MVKENAALAKRAKAAAAVAVAVVPRSIANSTHCMQHNR
jgi:hypothetical protein